MKTVLIVEDDPVNARVFSKILTKRGGLTVKHTENVEEVIQIAQNKEADLILMDVSLARSVYQGQSVDGIKITQMLKAEPDTAKLPIILVTAHAMAGDRTRHRIIHIRAVMVEGGQGADRADHDRHRVCIPAETAEELVELVVQHGMPANRPVEVFQLGSRGQFALQQEIANLDEGGLLGQLINRISAILQRTLVTIDIGDLAFAAAG